MGTKLSNLEVKLAEVAVKPHYRKGKPVKGFFRRAKEGLRTHLNQGIQVPKSNTAQFNTVAKMHPDIKTSEIGDEITVHTPIAVRRGTLVGKNKNGIVLQTGTKKITIYNHHVKKVEKHKKVSKSGY